MNEKNEMSKFEYAASKVASRAFTKGYVSKQAGTAKMQKVFEIVMRKSVIDDGKIYRQVDGEKVGKPIGWIDFSRGIGALNLKGFKVLRRDADCPVPEYDEFDWDGYDEIDEDEYEDEEENGYEC